MRPGEMQHAEPLAAQNLVLIGKLEDRVKKCERRVRNILQGCPTLNDLQLVQLAADNANGTAALALQNEASLRSMVVGMKNDLHEYQRCSENIFTSWVKSIDDIISSICQKVNAIGVQVLQQEVLHDAEMIAAAEYGAEPIAVRPHSPPAFELPPSII